MSHRRIQIYYQSKHRLLPPSDFIDLSAKKKVDVEGQETKCAKAYFSKVLV